MLDKYSISNFTGQPSSISIIKNKLGIVNETYEKTKYPMQSLKSTVKNRFTADATSISSTISIWKMIRYVKELRK